MNSDIEIVLMSRDRIEYFREALDSLLSQSSSCVWVSDNSSTEAIAQLLRSEYPSVPVRYRRPNVSAYDHLNLILSEVEAPYFMIFHDDDVLRPEAIRVLHHALIDEPQAAAAAGNACFIRSGVRTSERFNPSLTTDLLISSPKDLAHRYLDFAKGINPFPGYLYRREKVVGLAFAEANLGQYADLAFLSDVCDRGSVCWLAQPLMDYRKHANNHSANVDLRSANRVLRFYSARGLFTRGSREARLFRYWLHLFHFKSACKSKRRIHRRQRYLLVRYFLLHPRSLLRRLLQKMSFRKILKQADSVDRR